MDLNEPSVVDPYLTDVEKSRPEKTSFRYFSLKKCGQARTDRKTTPATAVFCGLGMKILDFNPRLQDRGLCGRELDFARSGPDRARSHHWCTVESV